MSRTRKLVSLGSLGIAAIVMASCAASPSAPPATLAMLPSLTSTTVLSEAAPTEVVALPTETERPTQRWYAVSEDLIAVYDCADLSCGVIGTYENGEPVDVYSSSNAWHEIRLPDGSSAFVPSEKLSATEPTAEPSATGSVTPRPTRTLIPSRTPSNTPTPTQTDTPSSTPTGTLTFTPTRAISTTPFPTLPIQGPSDRGQRPGLPVGTVDEPGFYPTSTAPAPGTPGVIPPTLTFTQSNTPSPTMTATLAQPPGGGSPPPTVIYQPSPTSQPQGNTPPPGAGNPVPTSDAPPPGGGGPPPGSGNPVPTSDVPPPPPGPPPGA